MYIKVCDNGEGIRPDKLAEINETIRHKDWSMIPRPSMGLKNLTERLHLLYNDQAFFYLDSLHGVGTTSIIKLPDTKPHV